MLYTSAKLKDNAISEVAWLQEILNLADMVKEDFIDSSGFLTGKICGKLARCSKPDYRPLKELPVAVFLDGSSIILDSDGFQPNP